MVVTGLRLRDFRSYADAEVGLGERLTVVHGPNGAGKTNLLGGALLRAAPGARAVPPTSASWCASARMTARAARAVRVEVYGRDRDGAHELSVGFQPGEPKRFKVDGAPAERLLDAPHRPLVSVFLPDRLELVKGPPALRRSHLDQVVGALWPGRTANRRQYGQVLAQRNALLSRVRAGGLALGAGGMGPRARAPRHRPRRDDRARAVALLDGRFAEIAGELGLAGMPELRYRPRTKAETTPPSSRPSSPSASTPTCSAASRRTARTATTSRCCATGASCVPTAPRASSASPCSPCCSPSARSWPRSAVPPRCCCSTTS